MQVLWSVPVNGATTSTALQQGDLGKWEAVINNGGFHSLGIMKRTREWQSHHCKMNKWRKILFFLSMFTGTVALHYHDETEVLCDVQSTLTITGHLHIRFNTVSDLGQICDFTAHQQQSKCLLWQKLPKIEDAPAAYKIQMCCYLWRFVSKDFFLINFLGEPIKKHDMIELPVLDFSWKMNISFHQFCISSWLINIDR